MTQPVARLVTLCLAMVLGAAIGEHQGIAANPPLQALDTDHDGTVDLNEAKAAAASLFDRLDRDHDGTLDRRELKGRLGAAQFGAADPDHDGTLSKDEYLALVQKRFDAADRDHDGTLDSRELRSRAGRALMRLLS
jgi:EF hand